MSKLTLVIPTMDAVKYAEPAIRSISSQKEKHRVKILFVDESKDEFSRTYLTNLCAHYELENNIVKPPNKGQIESVTYGYQIAQTKYLAFFTVTDLYADTAYLSRAINYMDKNEEISYYHSNILTMRSDNILYPGLINRYYFVNHSETCPSQFYANFEVFGDGINELTCIMRTEIVQDIVQKRLKKGEYIPSIHYSIYAEFFNRRLLGYLDPNYSVIGRSHEGSLTLNEKAEKRAEEGRDEYFAACNSVITLLNSDQNFFKKNSHYKVSDSFNKVLYKEYLTRKSELLSQLSNLQYITKLGSI